MGLSVVTWEWELMKRIADEYKCFSIWFNCGTWTGNGFSLQGESSQVKFICTAQYLTGLYRPTGATVPDQAQTGTRKRSKEVQDPAK